MPALKRTPPTPKSFTPEDLVNLPLVQQAFNNAIHYFTTEANSILRDDVTDGSDDTPESPVEVVFLVWWKIEAARRALSHDPPELDLFPQDETKADNGKSYRLDFAVRPEDVDEWFEASERGIRFPDIAVEIDGHEWHERTKEQVASRNQRDRALQSVGWKVFHFSGSEVVRRPLECVTEVMDFAWTALCRMRKQLRNSRRHPQSQQPRGK